MNWADSDFLKDGFVDLGPIIDKTKCQKLLNDIYKTRNFGPDLFVSQKQHKENPKWTKTNPGPGINLTEKFDLDFIEDNDIFKNAMTKVLGPDYNIMLKTFVVGMPINWMPKWVLECTNDVMAANLGPWIKPEFQDMTYFRGLDFHQDLIDYKSRISDFITVYVYLNDVGTDMSPLGIIPQSHIFGATKFPHNIKMDSKKNKCEYTDHRGNNINLNYKFLTGNTGQTYFWSALTLHGTQSQMSHKPRISLRYLIERSKSNEKFLIDKLNDSINYDLSINETREDVQDINNPSKYTPLKGKLLKNINEEP